jgi:twitching motility protein PilT
MSEATSPKNSPAAAPAGDAAGSIGSTTDPLKLLGQVLAHAVRVNASDIHLRTRNHPILRVDGNLHTLREIPPLPPDFMERLSRTMMSARLLTQFENSHQVDLSIGFKDIGRVRANIFYQRGSIGMVLRVISTNIPTPEELFLPEIVTELTKLERGLVLLTGATGSGKSTTLASLINGINLARSEHIITIEDPVEFLFSEAFDHHTA